MKKFSNTKLQIMAKSISKTCADDLQTMKCYLVTKVKGIFLIWVEGLKKRV